MFVNNNKIENKPAEAAANPFAGEKARHQNKQKRMAIIVVMALVATGAAAAVFFLVSRSFAPAAETGQGNNAPALPGGFLPGQTGTTTVSDPDEDTLGDNARAELIGFGDFYHDPPPLELAPYGGYALPLDVKNQVKNYFYVTRKFDLEAHIGDLDAHGFASINNAFEKEADDFHALYRLLAEKGLPAVVTTDLIFYYFQNELKSVYEEIEKSVFYDNLWKIYKGVYDMALARYKNRLALLGVANDTVLEAQRQEVAYLAVLLQTLKPTNAQITKKGGLADIDKFSEEEALEYNFFMPDEIRLGAEKENGLLREALKAEKSPTFLRLLDYSGYKVPAHYRQNARLNNFYLAIRWLETPWPLYHKSDACPDCELDRRDWLINMAAAAYLSHDLGFDQGLKNKWAVIYKFVAFFTGLEKDLTYLDYLAAYREVFGEEAAIDRIFSDQNPERDSQADMIQGRLAEISLHSLHGGKKRDQSQYRLIGMRLLQDFYWPNTYILNELAGEGFRADTAALPAKEGTACGLKNSGESYRCRGSGFDIFNILDKRDSLPEKYAFNNAYAGYADKISLLRSQFGRFDPYEWHESVYWSTLHLVRQYLDYDPGRYPSYALGPRWRQERDLNTALGAWVNLHVPRDRLEYIAGRQGGTFNSSFGCDRHNSIEPRPDLIGQMVSQSEMLIDILISLGVTKKTSSASVQLREMNRVLNGLKSLMLKVQRRESLDQEDCTLLQAFSEQYRLTEAADRSFRTSFADGKYLTAANNGLRLLLLVYEAQGDLVVGFAPIFNYREY